MLVRCWFDVGSMNIGRMSSGAERVCSPSMDESGLSKMHRKLLLDAMGLSGGGGPPILTTGECNHRTQSHRTTQGTAMRSNRPRRLVKLGRHGMSEVPDHFDGAVAFGRKRGQETITKLRRLHWNVKIRLRRFPRAMTWWRGPSYSIWTCRGTG